MTQEREQEIRERFRKFVEERKSRTREQRIEHLLNRLDSASKLRGYFKGVKRNELRKEGIIKSFFINLMCRDYPDIGGDYNIKDLETIIADNKLSKRLFKHVPSISYVLHLISHWMVLEMNYPGWIRYNAQDINEYDVRQRKWKQEIVPLLTKRIK